MSVVLQSVVADTGKISFDSLTGKWLGLNRKAVELCCLSEDSNELCFSQFLLYTCLFMKKIKEQQTFKCIIKCQKMKLKLHTSKNVEKQMMPLLTYNENF